MKIAKWTIEAFLAIVGLWSGCITIADKYGIQLQGFMLWTAENSYWLLPLATFTLGLMLGWSLRKRCVDEEAMKDAIKEADRERRRKEEAEAERNRELYRQNRKIANLSDRQKAILFIAVEDGTITLEGSPDYIAAESLEKDGFLCKLESGPLLKKAWKATDLAQELVHEENIELWSELRDLGTKRRIEASNKKLDGQQAKFLSLDLGQKLFVYKVWESKGIKFDKHSAREYDSGFLNCEDIGNGFGFYTIKAEYEPLFTERGETCFRSVKEYIASKQTA